MNARAPKPETRKELVERSWDQFLRVLTEQRSTQDIEKLLATAITASERQKIAFRLAAIALLKAGGSYTRISRTLWLSPSTISAIKKSLRKNIGYVTRHERYKTEGRYTISRKSFVAKTPDTNIIPPHGKQLRPVHRHY